MMQKEINERILNLWEAYDQFMRKNRPLKDKKKRKYVEPWPRWPLLYSDSFKRNPDVLFVGLNPAFKKSAIERRTGEIVELDDLDVEPRIALMNIRMSIFG